MARTYTNLLKTMLVSALIVLAIAVMPSATAMQSPHTAPSTPAQIPVSTIDSPASVIEAGAVSPGAIAAQGIKAASVDSLAASSIITVGPSGYGYTSISDAISNATAGDTIIVHSGTYTPEIIVDKQLRIIGVDDGNGLPVIYGGIFGFDIPVNGTYIDGFVVRNASYYGVYIEASDCTVKNLTVSNSLAGIFVNPGYSGNILENNRIFCDTSIPKSIYPVAIDIQSSNSNLLENNSLSNYYYGLLLVNSFDNRLSGNVMSNNALNLAIIDNSKPYNIVDSSNLANGKPVIQMIGKSDVTIDRSWNPGDILLYECTNITVKDVSISNEFIGIAVTNSINPRIQNVSLSDNTYGIFVDISKNAVLQGNQISDCGLDGIMVGGSGPVYNNTLVSGNTITNSLEYGIFLLSVTGSSVTGNQVTGNAKETNGVSYGIQLDASTLSQVTENVIAGNYLGICLYNSTYNDVTGNVANDNTGAGLYLWNTSNDTLLGNNASGNGAVGVYVLNTTGSNVTGNTVRYNDVMGIYLNTSAGNVLWSNLVSNNVANASAYNCGVNYWNSTKKVAYEYNGHTYTNYTGNYWGNYTGMDNNADGIGDTPYMPDINVADTDYYPRMASSRASYSMSLSKGWNLVSIPLLNDSSLASDIPTNAGVDKVAVFNGNNQSFSMYRVGASNPGPDIQFIPDKGYLINCTRDGVVLTFYGVPVDGPRSLALYPGWNLIGWTPSYGSTAKAFGSLNQNTGRIARYIGSNATYATYLVGASRDDRNFIMSRGSGYFVYSNATTTIPVII